MDRTKHRRIFIKLPLLLKVILIGAVFLFCSVNGQASAEDNGKNTIAIIDVQRILQEATVAKNVQQQLESYRSKFQTEIVKEETELREAEKELARVRETTTPDVFAEREQKLRERFLAVERDVQSRRKALDSATTSSMNTIKKAVTEIVETLAKTRGFYIVILKQQTFWSDGKTDLTDDVLKQLEKELPTLTVHVTPMHDGEKPLALSIKKRNLKK